MHKKTLLQVYKEHNGKVSDKWHLYLNEYERLFQDYRGRAIHLLEIGVQNGGSLEIWAKYFEQAEKIVGVDIDERCTALQFDDARVAVVIGDVNREDTFEKICGISRNFDLIIDDGSHMSSDIIRSFSRYFPLVNPGGLYVVEDLHASYWKNFEGSLYGPFTAMSFFKRLVDVVNFEHWRLNKSRLYHLEPFIQRYNLALGDPDLLGLHSIEFINSMCVIRKALTGQNLLGPRLVVGQEEYTTSRNKEYDSSAISSDTVVAVEFDKENDWFEIAKRLTALQQENQRLQQEIMGYVLSMSWRITRPLRTIHRILNRLGISRICSVASVERVRNEHRTLGLGRWLSKRSGAKF